jgi:hypothetical protein
MAKKFDITKDGVSIVTEKNNYISLAAVMAYKMFVAPRIPNAYLSNASIAIVPAVAAGFATQDKSLVEKMFIAGLALGGVSIITDIITEIANKETDPAKRAKMQEAVYALSGYRPETVSGVEVKTLIDGRRVAVQYESPRDVKVYNPKAMALHAGTY